MPKWLRITLGITITTFIFLAVLGFIFFHMLTAPLPEYEGKLRSAQVKGDIEIYRDSMAIPYILAGSETDAAFGLGYVHAQERMFTMDITRRAGEGRLSEVLGSIMLPFDKMFLTLGIDKFATDNINRVDPEVLALLESYSDGVNHYLRENKGKYPVEFDILGYEPYEWLPEHSLIITRMIGWELNISWWNDYSFTLIASRIGEEKAREILPDYGSGGGSSLSASLKNIDLDMSFVNTDRKFREVFGFKGTQIGSNNWVVNDSVSASGKPVIANDPHLAYSAPGIWMAAVIRGGKWNAEGVTMPGVPGVVIGKNQDISWVLSSVMADDTDFYIEKLDSSGSNYMLDGKWVKLTSRKVKIRIKDSTDVDYVIRYTHRGPVVSGIHPYDFIYENEKHPKPIVSMRWTGTDFSDEMKAFYGLNTARNWDEFREALRSFALPGQNFVYADKSGNIGYVMGSRIPLRSGYNPMVVFDGTDSRMDWKGYLPYESQPKFYNPPAGFIATANNKVVEDFGTYITNLWEPDSRIQRINELLNSKKKHSAEDFESYQMDIISPYARNLTKYITDAFEGFKYNNEILDKSLDLLRKWDFSFNRYSQTPSIYVLFLDHLLKNIYRDELGNDLYNEFIFIGNIPYRSLLKVLSNPNSLIIDDVKTEYRESRNDIIRRSLINAVKELEGIFGNNIEEWQWGKLHKVEFRHAFGGVSGVVDKVVNIGPYSIGGDGTTIFNTEYPFNEGIKEFPRFDHDRFENDLGPSMRYIFDFKSPDEFRLVLTTGQSGHILSPHYKDMTSLWLEGKYMRIKTDLNSIKDPRNKLLKIYKD
jgi:penicillin G amidase